MLSSLHIENYALIHRADIQFQNGFVAITGETGAGKSIMLGALGLLLGQRADASVLADKQKKCVVEAHFDISGLQLEDLFAEADVDFDDRLIIRREILPSAKSRAFVNDTPVQLPFLRQLGSHILDIHSQHQTLTIADSTFRFSLLDTLSDKPVIDDYRAAFKHYSDLKRQLESLTTEDAAIRREMDYLQFQFDELAAARLVEGEQASLETQSTILSHAESLIEGLSSAAATIDGDSGTEALALLRSAHSALSHMVSFHPQVDDLAKRLESSIIELDDIHSEILNVADGINFSPELHQQVDDRLALIYRLEKKHSVDTVEQLIAIRDELDARLQSAASLDDRIHQLMEQVDVAYARLQTLADALTESRRRAADVLVQSVLPTLSDLGMPESRFEVHVSQLPTYTASGNNSVNFLFNANRGGELSDIAKIASGGELSRIMLAIKSVLTSCRLLPTIIFDEIDTGVSGDISVAVGQIMRRMATRMQVISITHLPQIAAMADQHLKVYKQVDSDLDRTVSLVRPLSRDERIVEVATMLSSDPPTQAALATASELMQ